MASSGSELLDTANAAAMLARASGLNRDVAARPAPSIDRPSAVGRPPESPAAAGSVAAWRRTTFAPVAGLDGTCSVISPPSGVAALFARRNDPGRITRLPDTHRALVDRTRSAAASEGDAAAEIETAAASTRDVGEDDDDEDEDEDEGEDDESA